MVTVVRSLGWLDDPAQVHLTLPEAPAELAAAGRELQDEIQSGASPADALLDAVRRAEAMAGEARRLRLLALVALHGRLREDVDLPFNARLLQMLRE